MFRRTFSRMRASPLRVSGVRPQRASNAVSSIPSHAAASIASGSNTGSNAALRCRGARRFQGQQLWQQSQPKIQPSRPASLSGTFSMVRHEMQRSVSMVRSGAMAPVGQASTHRRHVPQRSSPNGVS